MGEPANRKLISIADGQVHTVNVKQFMLTINETSVSGSVSNDQAAYKPFNDTNACVDKTKRQWRRGGSLQEQTSRF